MAHIVHADQEREPDLTVRALSGASAVRQLLNVRRGVGPIESIGLRSTSSSCRHIPYDVGAERRFEQRLPGATLTVQHVKRRSLVGTIRYVERFEHGVLVERTVGRAPAFDVYVENDIGGMLSYYERPSSAGGFGGAFVRCRDEVDLVVVGSLYGQESLHAHLSQHVHTNRLAAELGEILDDDRLEELSQRDPTL